MSYKSYSAAFTAKEWDGKRHRRMHPEARKVTDFGTERNDHFPNVDRGLREQWPDPRPGGDLALTASRATDKHGVPTQWAGWLGKPMAAGVFGVTFRLANSGPAAAALQLARRRASFLVEGKEPAAGAGLVLKIARDFDERYPRVVHPKNRVDAFVRESLKESSWHRHLDDAACLRLDGVSRGACIANHVPDFHWSGMVVDSTTGRRFYVTLMGVAPGLTVSSYAAGKAGLTADVYLAIERAAVLMWLYGVAHTDFHTGNMMVDPATGAVTIIDFGQGIKLHESLVAKLRATVPRAIAAGVRSLGELWLPPKASRFGVDVQRFADRVRTSRHRRDGFDTTGLWYNPDGHVLMQLYKRLSPQQRAAAALRRRALWGVGGPPAAAPARAPLRPTQPAQPAAAAGRRSRDTRRPGKRTAEQRRQAVLQAAAVQLKSGTAGRRRRLMAAALAAWPAARPSARPSPRLTRSRRRALATPMNVDSNRSSRGTSSARRSSPGGLAPMNVDSVGGR